MRRRSEESLRSVLAVARDRFVLDEFSLHGADHWERVRENGLRIAAHYKIVKVDVIELFAYLHDCCRESDGSDPHHGPRAAEFAETLRGSLIDLDDQSFELLRVAIACHTTARTHDALTVKICWDADRLDLGRVGIRPEPRRLCTKFAKEPSTIHWAYARSLQGPLSSSG